MELVYIAHKTDQVGPFTPAIWRYHALVMREARD